MACKPSTQTTTASNNSGNAGGAGASGPNNTTPPINPNASPVTNCSQLPMSQDQYRAYIASISTLETGSSAGDYTKVNTIGYTGKYQFGASALASTGYIKPQYANAGNSVLNNPDAWTGKDGVNSVQDFKNNPGAQENAMCQFTAQNYNSLNRQGLVSNSTDPAVLGGALGVAHNAGAGGAASLMRQYNSTGVFPTGSTDGYGTDRSKFFSTVYNGVKGSS